MDFQYYITVRPERKKRKHLGIKERRAIKVLDKHGGARENFLRHRRIRFSG